LPREGFKAWSLLAAKTPQMTTAHTLLANLSASDLAKVKPVYASNCCWKGHLCGAMARFSPSNTYAQR
jgi:hypothetical protein